MTSRGPAARKSGTSKPRARRRADGTPSSSSSPCTNSASAWLRAPATLTSWPSEYWRLILRARSARAVTLASPAPAPAKTSGIPHAAQNRSLGGYVVAQAGQTSERGSELGDVRAIDPVGPHAGVAVRQPDDDPRRPRPRLGERDVRLRRVGRR